MSEFPPDYVIAERYKVVAPLGAGGMGAVYLVEELTSNHRYALKTILAANSSERNLQRFEQEARATRRLTHPNLVQVFDYGLINKTQPFFVMELCEGQDLAAIIKSAGCLSVDKAIDVFITICNALTFAHTQGVIHRDLKPSNVMISENAIKVLDFGIAKVFRDDTQYNTVTQTGEIFGSPYYMSPEQCLGKAVDMRADVYSLGCMLYESLTGVPPFVGETALATMLKHQSETPITLKQATVGGNFPEELEVVISRMLAKSAGDRYPDLLLVAEDLRRIRQGEKISEGKEATQEKPLDRRVLIAGLVAAVICAFVCVSVLRPNEKQTYQKPFDIFQKDEKIPAIEEAQKRLPEHSGYFSVLKSKDDNRRDFYFPEHSIGDIGYGVNLHEYLPAFGIQKGLKIPFSLHIKHDPNSIPCFRSDEVEYLVLRGYLIEDKNTDGIKDWTKLKAIVMDDTEISDKSVANFKGSKALRVLSVSDTHITGAGLLTLDIQNLYSLGANRLTNAKIVLPRLREGNSITTLSMIKDELNDDDMKILGQCKKLAELDILDNPITDAGLQHLAKLESLSSLWVDSTNLTPASVSIFKQMKLSSLVIGNCPWTREQAKEFRNVLRRSHKTLGRLDIKFKSEKQPVNNRF